MMTTRRSGIIVLLVIVLAGMPAMLQMRDPVDRLATLPPVDGVYPADGLVGGRTVSDWHADYWRWLLQFPIAESPALDPRGERCGAAQDARVFFIPAHLPPCDVPAGVPILVPITAVECSTVEAPPYYGEDEAALRACAAEHADRTVDLRVTVDGDAVDEIEAYRAVTPVFEVALPEHNILAVPPQTGEVAAAGVVLILAPLGLGTHKVVISSESVDGYALPDTHLELRVVAGTATD